MKRCWVVITVILNFFGCLLDDPLSGDSDAGAPDSILGYQFVGYVQENDDNPGAIGVGKRMTYKFVDRYTVLGDGLNELAPSWSYTASGNIATFRLDYRHAIEIVTMTFTSELEGTFKYDKELLLTGTTRWCAGTFTIRK